MARAMGSASKSMARVNAMQDPQKVAATMRDYQMQQEKMSMTQEMMDDIMEGDDDEEEEADAVVDEVFDELGLELEDSVCITPSFCNLCMSSPFLFTLYIFCLFVSADGLCAKIACCC